MPNLMLPNFEELFLGYWQRLPKTIYSPRNCLNSFKVKRKGLIMFIYFTKVRVNSGEISIIESN